MRLTKTFPAETYASALESWSWLEVGTKVPVLATLFGDVFLQDAESYWFLDTVEGNLARVATTKDELQTKVNTQEGADQYLLAGLAMLLESRGLVLQPNEVYDFKVPPVLGGKIDPANVVTTDFEMALSIAGQIHDQVRNLPPGTKIKGFQIEKP